MPRTGYAGGGGSRHVTIVASGGEFVIAPEVVRAVGGDDLDAGHRVLSAFVLHTRKQHIKQLKTLRRPKN